MPGDELGRAVHDQVSAELDRLLQAGSHHRAVDLHEGVLRVRDAADVGDVEDALHRVGRAFDHDQLGVLSDDSGEVRGTCGAGHVHVANLDVIAGCHLEGEDGGGEGVCLR